MTRNVPLSTAKSFAAPKRKLVAAVCMLLISAIALISSTYAWYTLSVAPEARDISTSVAGNGSLEIALVPANGDLTTIKFGRVLANDDVNRYWGNLINLDADDYGIAEEKNMMLTPMALSETESFVLDDEGRLAAVVLADFGYDGRNKSGAEAAAYVKSFISDPDDPSANKFQGDAFGVRAIVDEAGMEATDLGSVYGYVIDLAFRLNAKEGGKLLIEQNETQRIYNSPDNLSSNDATQGEGSTLKFYQAGDGPNAEEEEVQNADLSNAVRLAFVKDFANNVPDPETGNARTPVVIAYGKADANGNIILCDSEGNPRVEDELFLLDMEKDEVYQISVFFWLDGTQTTSAAYSSDAVSTKVKLNLQFATDTVLVPYKDTELHTP